MLCRAEALTLCQPGLNAVQCCTVVVLGLGMDEFYVGGPGDTYLINRFNPRRYLCTTRCGSHKFYTLSTECIYLFCMDLSANNGSCPIGN